MLLWAYGSARFFGIVYIFGLVWFVLSSEKNRKAAGKIPKSLF